MVTDVIPSPGTATNEFAEHRRQPGAGLGASPRQAILEAAQRLALQSRR